MPTVRVRVDGNNISVEQDADVVDTVENLLHSALADALSARSAGLVLGAVPSDAEMSAVGCRARWVDAVEQQTGDYTPWRRPRSTSPVRAARRGVAA